MIVNKGVEAIKNESKTWRIKVNVSNVSQNGWVWDITVASFDTSTKVSDGQSDWVIVIEVDNSSVITDGVVDVKVLNV